MRSIIVLAAVCLLTVCDSLANMVATSGSEAISSEPESSPDWVPEPPFGRYVADYEFFPDSIASTFDSLSTAFDTVTWRDEDFLRFTAYGKGWETPVFTDGDQFEVLLGLIRPRVEKYMTHFGRLGAGILSQVPEYGIGLLDRVPRSNTRCPLGMTAFVGLRGEGFWPTAVVLIYPRWVDRLSLDYDSRYSECDDARGISATGVMLHELGHVLADPHVGCTERWRDALLADSARFPSVYARYDVKGYHPEGARANYWECKDYPPVEATEADTIPSGEDIAESFSMWWLTRCKTGDEPVMDALVESWFPNRLAVLDQTLDPRAQVDSVYIPTCQFPITPLDKHLIRFLDELFQPDTIPDGIIVR